MRLPLPDRFTGAYQLPALADLIRERTATSAIPLGVAAA